MDQQEQHFGVRKSKQLEAWGRKVERCSWMLDLVEARQVKKDQSPALWQPLLIHCREVGAALVSSPGSCSSNWSACWWLCWRGWPTDLGTWSSSKVQSFLHVGGREWKRGRGSAPCPALSVVPALPPKTLKALQDILMAFQGVAGPHAQKDSTLSLILC